ncbi:reverse transcriptase [Senna tora]|uniref:Reverse transcriptase n=1 Tax=Senna tora TaxID=362788 RepID=A0A834X692_9FABA|nr:reverse transcriptase [Senna tora]
MGFWKSIWKMPLNSRYKVFLWRACIGNIPTVETLKQREKRGHFAIALYYIWESRNRKKFEGEVINLNGLWMKVERCWDEFRVAGCHEMGVVEIPQSLRWEKPKQPFMKMNVDAGVRRNGDGALGGVLRDWNGCVQATFISSTPKLGDVALIEALAVERGVRVAMEAGVKNLIIESDSRLVVDMLNSNCKHSSVLGTEGARLVDGRALVGKLIFEKHLNRNTVMVMIRKGWNMKEELTILEVQVNTFLFSFVNLEDYKRILKGGLSRGNVIRMGSKVGEVLIIEDLVVNGRLIRSFARARVLIDLDKPLVAGFWVPRPQMSSIWISVKYEKLHQFCYKCGCVGHDFKVYKTLRRAMGNDGKPLYGEWLGVASRLEEDWSVGVACEEETVAEARDFVRENEDFVRSRRNGKDVVDVPPNLSRLNDVVGSSSEKRTRVERGMEGKVEGISDIMMNDVGESEAHLGVGLSSKKSRWSPTGYVVDIPFDSEGDKENDIIPYHSPKGVADVIMGLGSFSLKRPGGDLLSSVVGKRRKVFEKAISSKASISIFMDSDLGQGSSGFCAGKSSEKKSKKRTRVKESQKGKFVAVQASVDDESLFSDKLFKFRFQVGVDGEKDEGLGVALTVKALRELCRKFKPHVVFLMETRCRSVKMENIRRRKILHFDQDFYVDPVGKSGGLAIWWKEEIGLNILFHSKNFIHSRLVTSELDVPDFLTCVYGPPVEGERRITWDRLRGFGCNISSPWLYLGDFNDDLYHSEKDCGLFDLEYKGPFFTWSNERPGDAHVKERLDRALGNVGLLCSFPKAQVFVNDPIGSDHSPLIVDLNFSDSKSERVFKFEMFWLDHPGYKEVMRQGWFKSMDPWEDVIKELLRRRRRNKILRLKNDEGNWLCAEGEVAGCFTNFYSSLFKKGGPRDLRKVIDCVSPVISEEDNNDLLRKVSVLEVKEAVFQLGGLKAPGPDGYYGIFYQNAWEDVGDQLFRLVSDFFEKGQEVNFDKSCLFFSANASGDVREEVCGLLGVSERVDPGSYLGLPMVLGKSKLEALAYVRERMMKKMHSWKNNFLSHAGREVLIKAVVNAIPCYSMSVFKFLKSSYMEFDNLIANFWWGLKEDGSKVHWRAWSKLIRPKDEGGLGFKDFENFNLSLLAKQSWRILESPNDLWVQVLKGLYFPSGDFLSAKKGHRASWVWSSILEGRELFLEGACWKVGDGSSVLVWGDRWVPGLHDFRSGSVLPESLEDLKVGDLICNGSWDLSVVSDFISPVEERAIKAVPILNSSSDRLLWPFSKRGSYESIWKIKAIPKVKFFLWRACVEALPTKEALFKRKCASSPYCQICGVEVETIEHAILLCDWAKCVWFACPLAFKVSALSISRFDVWCMEVLFANGEADDRCRTLAAVVCWEIWKTRCNFIFKGILVDPVVCCRKIVSAFVELESALGANSATLVTPKVSSISDKWENPVFGAFKVNVDGAFLQDSLDAGIGLLFRDASGNMVKGFCGKALAFSAEFPDVRITYEMDCKELFLMVDSLGSVGGDWRCEEILDDIISVARSSCLLSFALVRRGGNQAADWLAKCAVKGLAPLGWVSHPPPPLALVLARDREVAARGASPKVGIG